MRPPSSIPTGVRLNRLRKDPNQARAKKSGRRRFANNIANQSAEGAEHRTADPDAGFHPRVFRGFLQRDERAHEGNKNGAPTLSPNFLATMKWPLSCTNNGTTKPSANFQPHITV